MNAPHPVLVWILIAVMVITIPWTLWCVVAAWRIERDTERRFRRVYPRRN